MFWTKKGGKSKEKINHEEGKTKQTKKAKKAITISSCWCS